MSESDETPTVRPQRKPRAATPRGARKTYADAALKQGRGFTPDRQAEYLSSLARGMRKGEAAAAAGINATTVNAYRKKDPAFEAAEAEAETQACDVIESALWELARTGHFGAITYWLGNRARARWEDTRTAKVRHEGTVKYEIDVGSTLESIAALQATLSERAALRSGLELGPPVIEAELVDE